MAARAGQKFQTDPLPRAAHKSFFDLEMNDALARKPSRDFLDFCHDLGADAVARGWRRSRRKEVRRATRRHFSAEDKIRVVLEGLRGEESIAELPSRGNLQILYYRRSKDFLE
jgi:hypothetical protein